MQQRVNAIGNGYLKSICMALFLLFLIPNIFSYEGCRDASINVDDIPCLFFLPYDGNCADVSVTIYLSNISVDSQTMFNRSPDVCGAYFNFTTLGTYTGNYSTGDTFKFIVEEGNKMIYLLYFGLIVSIGLLALGFYLKNNPITAIGGFFLLVLGLWIIKNGFSIYDNLVTDGLGTVFIALGGYFLIMSVVAMVEGD